jgi:hypothetical protein
MLTIAREIREAVLAGKFQAYQEGFWRNKNAELAKSRE